MCSFMQVNVNGSPIYVGIIGCKYFITLCIFPLCCHEFYFVHIYLFNYNNNLTVIVLFMCIIWCSAHAYYGFMLPARSLFVNKFFINKMFSTEYCNSMNFHYYHDRTKITKLSSYIILVFLSLIHLVYCSVLSLNS